MELYLRTCVVDAAPGVLSGAEAWLRAAPSDDDGGVGAGV